MLVCTFEMIRRMNCDDENIDDARNSIVSFYFKKTLIAKVIYKVIRVDFISVESRGSSFPLLGVLTLCD